MDLSATKWAALLFLAAATLAVAAGCGGGGGKKKAAAPQTLPSVQLAKNIEASAVELYGRQGNDWVGGTGIVIDAAKGLALTNAHVIAGVSALHVQHGTDDVVGQVVGEAPCDDVALVRMTEPIPGLKSITWATTPVHVTSGEHVTAIGYPATFQDKPEVAKATVTDGIVSVEGTVSASPDKSLPHYNSVIQHSAAINPGNSGGPLVNDYGRLLGMNTLHNTGAGGEVQNQGYAITIDHLRTLLPKLKRGKRIDYVGWDLWPAAYLTNSDLNSLKYKYDPQGKGLVVLGVDPGSPAARRNFKFGDYIDAINGSDVNTMTDVCDVVTSQEGQLVEVAGKYMNHTGAPIWTEKVRPK